MLEALCRQSSTTLDIVHAEDGPPITKRTSGLVEPKRDCSIRSFYAPARSTTLTISAIRRKRIQLTRFCTNEV
jgi:hypothetical protein